MRSPTVFRQRRRGRRADGRACQHCGLLFQPNTSLKTCLKQKHDGATKVRKVLQIIIIIITTTITITITIIIVNPRTGAPRAGPPPRAPGAYMYATLHMYACMQSVIYVYKQGYNLLLHTYNYFVGPPPQAPPHSRRPKVIAILSAAIVAILLIVKVAILLIVIIAIILIVKVAILLIVIIVILLIVMVAILLIVRIAIR